jgi:hypothetical protein
LTIEITEATEIIDWIFSVCSVCSVVRYRRPYSVQSPRRLPEYFIVISWPCMLIFIVPV